MTPTHRPTAPNITIDRDTATIPTLTITEVPDRLGQLDLSDTERAEVVRLAAEFDAEFWGARSSACFGEILESFRAVSIAAYEHVGKPLFLGFVRRRSSSEC